MYRDFQIHFIDPVPPESLTQSDTDHTVSQRRHSSSDGQTRLQESLIEEDSRASRHECRFAQSQGPMANQMLVLSEVPSSQVHVDHSSYGRL